MRDNIWGGATYRYGLVQFACVCLAGGCQHHDTHILKVPSQLILQVFYEVLKGQRLRYLR